MKTKVVKQYHDDGSLWREYEVLETDENMRHGFYKVYWGDGKTIKLESIFINNKEHGEEKWYNIDGIHYDSWWFFESKYIGGNQEGQQKFKELNKPYVFLENCKNLGI